MQDARNHQRIVCRLPVDLVCGDDMNRLTCYTQDIGVGGMFANGAQCMRPADRMRIELGPSHGEKLHLSGKIARVTSTGAALQFVGNSPATIEVLQALLSPAWDGGSLLDGVVRIAPWYHDSNLVGWMRLTSIVSDWQKPTSR
ncbi:MAG: PilZ domain-containing protein [Gammaproteobacteria bacterium]|nr:PilZ domain-containing protein [Gammaproteobacteria bacterium]